MSPALYSNLTASRIDTAVFEFFESVILKTEFWYIYSCAITHAKKKWKKNTSNQNNKDKDTKPNNS